MDLHLLTHSLPRSMFAVSMFAVTMFAVPLAEAQTAAPDGKVFVAEAGEKGKAAKEKDDVLTFANGRFHSSSCDEWGYDKGVYKASSSGEETTFEAETNSAKYGKLVWKGTVRGNEIEGTFMEYPKPWFFNSNPAPIEHWFKGRPKT
jgi:hypothetical protein